MKIIVVLFLILLLMVGCSSTYQSDDSLQPKAETITVCDFFGWSSDSIIKEQLVKGYEFVDSSDGFICQNDLHFKLKTTE